MIILSTLLVLQIWDGSQIVAAMNNPIAKRPAPTLYSPFWNHLRDAGSHLYVLPVWGTIPLSAIGQIFYEAVLNGVTTNYFWLGRYPWAAINNTIDNKIKGLAQGNLQNGDILLINHLESIKGAKLANSQTYLVDGLLLIGKHDLDKTITGIEKADVQQIPLAAYIKHLSQIASHSLILLSARQTNTPQRLSPVDFAALGLSKMPDSLAGKAYAAVIVRGDVVYEKLSKIPFSVPADIFSRKSTPPISVILSPDLQTPPIVEIGGATVSRAVFGLNIAVFDLETNQIQETGSFEDFFRSDGITITADEK